MAATIREWAKATKGRFPNTVQRIQKCLTSGTTSQPEDCTVVYIDEEEVLAFVSWDFGAKQIVSARDPRNESDAERAALLRLFPEYTGRNDLPRRLTGAALSEVIAKISKAGAVWSAVVGEEAMKVARKRKDQAAEAWRASAQFRKHNAVAQNWDAIRAAIDAVLAGPQPGTYGPLHDAYVTLRVKLHEIDDAGKER
jgi:hypothetical protein